MPKVFLPNHGGYVFYHIPTSPDFYKVKAWGLPREAFDIALVYMCIEKIDGMKIPEHTKTSYETLRQLMLSLPPDDEGVLIEAVLQATAIHYAKT